MKPPILIVESYDISVHPSIEHAERFLEPFDVKNGIYTAYDYEGNLLDLYVTKETEKSRLFFLKWSTEYEKVNLRDRQPIENRQAELREKLFEYLQYRGKKPELEQMDFVQLIGRVRKYMPW